MSLLEACIRELVREAIARPPPQKRKEQPGSFRPQFKLNEFKALKTLPEMLDYAHRNLEELGFGSSRSVFRLSGTKVLKLANTMTKGTAQNKAEAEIFTDPKTAPVITRIYDYDPKFRWLVSEVVRPFSGETGADDFQHATGIDWGNFFEMLSYLKHVPNYWNVDEQQRAFLEAALSLSQRSGLMIGDLAFRSHWGKTADGRVVLLDYGFTSDVAKSYDGKKMWSQDDTDDRPSLKPLEPEKQAASTQPSPGNELDWGDLNDEEPESGTRATAGSRAKRTA